MPWACRRWGRVGAPAYDSRSMFKLLVYGYSYGRRSSRKLERGHHYNLSFIWLAGGLKPDHETIVGKMEVVGDISWRFSGSGWRGR